MSALPRKRTSELLPISLSTQNSGSFAAVAAIRRASSRVSGLALSVVPVHLEISVAPIRLAGPAFYDPACRAAARERAVEARIVLPVHVPVGTSPISMPVAMMVVMLLSERPIGTSY
jgi:hypothetical protein